MERMELEYFERAKEKGIHVVNCCGFDSVPADEGMLFAKEQFHYCTWAESFLALKVDNGKGFAGHATTFECVVHGIGAAGELKDVRKKLADIRPEPVPFDGPKLKARALTSPASFFPPELQCTHTVAHRMHSSRERQTGSPS